MCFLIIYEGFLWSENPAVLSVSIFHVFPIICVVAVEFLFKFVNSSLFTYFRPPPDHWPQIHSTSLTLNWSNVSVIINSQNRNCHFKQHFTFIEPIGIRLGADDRGIPKYMHYVPIRESLTAFLGDQTVIEQCINSATSGFNGVYSDFTDGKIFRQDGSDCIRIMLYQDAFEVANPLGSAKSKHKILAVYYSLGNLMAKHRSRVDQMQLAAWGNCKYMHKTWEAKSKKNCPECGLRVSCYG